MREVTFETPGKTRLNVRIPAGRVRIEATEGLARTTVSLRALNGGTEAEEQAVIRSEGGEGRHTIDVLMLESKLFGFLHMGAAEVDLDIRCPADSDLLANLVSASLNVRGRLGTCEVSGVSGEVFIDHTRGDATIKTVSGAIEVADVGGNASGRTVSGSQNVGIVAGSAELHTVSGRINAGRVGGPATARSISGTIEIGSVSAGATNLRSLSGDIEVGVPRGTHLWIDARSMSGKTRSELPVSDEKSEDVGPLVELRASSMSGNITIRRASSTAPAGGAVLAH